MRAIVTVLGKDKPGIIAKISGALLEYRGNIVDITQTVLRDEYFAMIMMVDLSEMKASFEEWKQYMEKSAEEIQMEIKIQREEFFQSMHRI